MKLGPFLQMPRYRRWWWNTRVIHRLKMFWPSYRRDFREYEAWLEQERQETAQFCEAEWNEYLREDLS